MQELQLLGVQKVLGIEKVGFGRWPNLPAQELAKRTTSYTYLKKVLD